MLSPSITVMHQVIIMFAAYSVKLSVKKASKSTPPDNRTIYYKPQQVLIGKLCWKMLKL